MLHCQRERVTVDGLGNVEVGKWKSNKELTIGREGGIISLKKSVKIPDDCTYLLNASTNFEGKDISQDILKTINDTIEARLEQQPNFVFD